MKEIFVRHQDLTELGTKATHSVRVVEKTTTSSDLNKPDAIQKGRCDLRSATALANATNAFSFLIAASLAMCDQEVENAFDLASTLLLADEDAASAIAGSE